MPGATLGQVVRSRHDERPVLFFLKNRAKPLTAPACHIDDETSTHVPGQMHGRQSVAVTNSHVLVFELPAQLFATSATCKGQAGVTGELAQVDTIILGTVSAELK